MFDVGFSELVLCFVVALVVLGPERLPAVARAFGRWTGMARVYLRNLSAELERETQAAELKKQLLEARQSIEQHAAGLQQSVKDEAGKLAHDADPRKP
ncbi:MAG TPA: Sec-independent protein translocase protein TatB [Nevskiaceae bacterium]|nr:Sec-independent protein translocase protein TatB [Nevskiaceae bacterium]